MNSLRTYFLGKSTSYFVWNINLVVCGLIGDGLILGGMVVGGGHSTLIPYLESRFGIWVFVMGGLILIAHLNWLVDCYALKKRLDGT